MLAPLADSYPQMLQSHIKLYEDSFLFVVGANFRNTLCQFRRPKDLSLCSLHFEELLCAEKLLCTGLRVFGCRGRLFFHDRLGSILGIHASDSPDIGKPFLFHGDIHPLKPLPPSARRRDHTLHGECEFFVAWPFLQATEAILWKQDVCIKGFFESCLRGFNFLGRRINDLSFSASFSVTLKIASLCKSCVAM